MYIFTSSALQSFIYTKRWASGYSSAEHKMSCGSLYGVKFEINNIILSLYTKDYSEQKRPVQNIENSHSLFKYQMLS